jgi:hypothetical protein
MKIFCPPESADAMKGLVKDGVTIIACQKLDDAVYQTWRELAPMANDGAKG